VAVKFIIKIPTATFNNIWTLGNVAVKFIEISWK